MLCKKCNIEKNIDCFAPWQSRRTYPTCRACIKVKGVQWYIENKDEHSTIFDSINFFLNRL